MLIEFTIGNYLSFKDKITLSLKSTSIKEFSTSNVIENERHSLLKSAVIYGANSSGKSNLIKALSKMRQLVLSSSGKSSTEKLGIVPFLMSTETSTKPSFFEILFLKDGIQYRYGFEIDINKIHAEWLFEAKKKKEVELFIRNTEGIQVSEKFKEGKDLEIKTRENALFLSILDQFNGRTAKKIITWFNSLITVSGLSHEDYKTTTFGIFEHQEKNKRLIQFYQELNLGFSTLNLRETKIDPRQYPMIFLEQNKKDLTKELNDWFRVKIYTVHEKYDEKQEKTETVFLDMETQESAGTNKIFNLSGPIFEVLLNGGILVVDEMDSSLHPLLTLSITKLFNSKEQNPNNAQLIFTTHDTNLLTYGNFRRDQIYFVEKDDYGSSDLYSLVEFKENEKTVRNDRSFEKDYIQGRYGAIPFIGDLSNLISNPDGEEN
jgi:AAA15 family ATPase/GTPase